MDKIDGMQTPFLKVLRFGVCPKCLQRGEVDFSAGHSRVIHFHCTNPECKAFQEDVSMPVEVFDVLSYLEDHQPEDSEIQERV